MSEVKPIPVWQADAEWSDEELVVRASNYDALRAENERLERERAEQWNLRRDREAERDTNAAVAAELRAELVALKAVPDGVEVVAWAGEDIEALISHECKQYGESMGGAAGSAVAQHKTALMAVAQHNAIVAALRQPVAGERCEYCDGTGDVHGLDGEWRGECHCMKSVADEREAFEAWWVSRPHRKMPEKFTNGDYIAPSVHSSWGVWQARAALSAPAAGQKPVVFAVHSPEVGVDPDSSLVDEEDAALYAPECVTPLYAAPTTAGQSEQQPAYATCNGRSCGWCKQGKAPCLFSDDQRKARDLSSATRTADAPDVSALVEALKRATKLLSAAAGYATKMEPMPAKLLNAIDAELDAHKAGGSQ